MQETDLISKYGDELKNDFHIDQLNLKEQSMKIISFKHKWVARLINHKQNLNKLKKLYKLTKDKAIDEIRSSSPVTLTLSTLEAKADNTDLCKSITNKIQEENLIIDYLDKVESIFRSMTYDIKNLIDIIKLETT